ncbi:MAG: hypothetical protein IT389_13535 [Nitrospira sp.]|nr:hypothetical protein [Nitrospira sp.]
MPVRRPDRLERLIVGIAVLNGLHAIDHVLRGDFHWPIDDQSIGFIVVIAAIYLVIGLGLIGYRRGAVGPRFWAGIGLSGLALGWLSHFSPFTDQPVSVIFHAYHTPVMGGIAVALLILLMLLVLVATLQAFIDCGMAKNDGAKDLL